MHHSILHTIKITLVGIALALFVAALASLGGFSADPARAATGDNVSGFAWSDTIGWISFYGDNYGVDVDETTGAFSGYAWSDATGWINFSPDVSGAPENPKTATRVDFGAASDLKPVTGWARACAVFQVGCAGTLKPDTARGGWDGWIKMHNVSLDAPDADGARTFSGFAWGSEVMGWISMAGVSYGGALALPPPPITPSVTLTPPVQSVAEGGSADITWKIENMNGASCVAPPGWSVPQIVSSGSVTGTEGVLNVASPKTYTLTCTLGETQKSATAEININPFIQSFRVCNAAFCDTAISILNGGTARYEWTTANFPIDTTCTLNSMAVLAVCDGICATTETFTLPPEEPNFASYSRTLQCDSVSKTVAVNVRNQDFILQADPVDIKITSIGDVGDTGGRGTGGVSSKTKIIALANIAKPIILSVVNDPFLGYDHTYHFQLVPLESEDPIPDETMSSGELPVARYLSGINFWIESAEPLPAVSDTLVTIQGDPDSSRSGDERTIVVHLNSRLFDPEYREI